MWVRDHRDNPFIVPVGAGEKVFVWVMVGGCYIYLVEDSVGLGPQR